MSKTMYYVIILSSVLFVKKIKEWKSTPRILFFFCAIRSPYLGLNIYQVLRSRAHSWHDSITKKESYCIEKLFWFLESLQVYYCYRSIHSNKDETYFPSKSKVEVLLEKKCFFLYWIFHQHKKMYAKMTFMCYQY